MQALLYCDKKEFILEMIKYTILFFLGGRHAHPVTLSKHEK
jgi:hypothetical protein